MGGGGGGGEHLDFLKDVSIERNKDPKKELDTEKEISDGKRLAPFMKAGRRLQRG